MVPTTLDQDAVRQLIARARARGMSVGHDRGRLDVRPPEWCRSLSRALKRHREDVLAELAAERFGRVKLAMLDTEAEADAVPTETQPARTDPVAGVEHGGAILATLQRSPLTADALADALNLDTWTVGRGLAILAGRGVVRPVATDLGLLWTVVADA